MPPNDTNLWNQMISQLPPKNPFLALGNTNNVPQNTQNPYNSVPQPQSQQQTAQVGPNYPQYIMDYSQKFGLTPQDAMKKLNDIMAQTSDYDEVRSKASYSGTPLPRSIGTPEVDRLLQWARSQAQQNTNFSNWVPTTDFHGFPSYTIKSGVNSEEAMRELLSRYLTQLQAGGNR